MNKSGGSIQSRAALLAGLLLVACAWSGFGATTLVSTGAVWRYLDNGSNQGTNWIAPAFNDGAWASGAAELGYGDGGEATVVGYGPDANNKYITTYFRRAFVVGNPALYQNLTLRVMRDDGVLVYLNGTEIFRNNLPAGAVSYTTLALVNISGADESAFYLTNVLSSLLVTGTNVLAVEMHQFVGTSADISFDLSLIDSTTNLLPSVTITEPTNGAALVAATNLTLTATASDIDGTVTNVFFLAGASALSNAASNGAGGFSLAWSNTTPGNYSLRAVATDNLGASQTSAVVNVTLHDPVVRLIAPTNGATFIIPVDVPLAASITDSNAVVARVDFYSGATLRGTATNEPWAATWSNAPAGSFTLTAVAVDINARAYTSAPVAITITTNVPPSVAITSPTNNSSFQPGSTIAITASASDSDGTVTSVQFTANGTNLGSVASAPFNFSWANVAAANYVLRAVALDNRGLSATSAPITVVVSAATVTRGPYLQMNTTNSVIVRWRTSLATDSRVAYGLNAATLTNLVSDVVNTNEHIVMVSNLPPDTKFFYTAGTSNGALAGGDTNYFFTTSPLIGANKNMRLWVLGDAGTAPLGATQKANQQAVRDSYYNFAASSRAADLILLLGDNAYNSGTDSEYQTGLFDIYPTALRNTPAWSTVGNHETAQQTTIATFPYLDIFSLPQSAESGGVASGTERYYSFDYGNVHFVCLDSQTSSTATNGAMAEWLRADLAANLQLWTIAFWHHPPYSKGSHDSDTEAQMVSMRTKLVPILEAYGVDLALSGHSHSYERSYLINGHYGISSTFSDANKLDAGDGSTNGYYQKNGPDGAIYAVAGASGQTSGFSGTHPAMLRSLSVLSSMVLDLSSNRLDAVLLGTTSNVLDRFTIVKGNYFTSPPAAPTNFTATATATNQIVLSWANNSTNEIGFTLESSLDGSSFAPLTTLGANFTTYTNSSLLTATTYYYRVRATNSAGVSAWANAAATTLGAPAIPSSFAATLTATNQITLTWINTATNATSLRLERSLDGASYSLLASLATNVTSYADSGLLYSTTYYYRIRATNNLGASPWATVAGTTLGAPVIPPNFSDTSVTNFPYQGVTYIVRTNTAYGDGLSVAGVPGLRTVVMHVMVIDLATPGLQFRLTPPAGTNDTRRQTTLNFCTQQVAQVAVNTHFFLPVSSELDVVLAGLAASDGNVYSPFKSQPIAYNKTASNPAGTTLTDQSYAIVDYAPSLNIDSNNGVSIVTRHASFTDNKHVNEPVTLHNAISGNFQIISNGVKRFPTYVNGAHGFNTLNPLSGYSASNPYYASTVIKPRARTALGYTADNKLVIFTLDENGGSNGSASQGAKITEIAETLRTDYHCTNALNCDGGTSTTLVLQSPADHVTSIINQSSDSAAGRAEGANLAVFAATYPVITQHPVSRTNNLASTASFSVTPRVTPALYQWFKAGSALAGQTNATLALVNVQNGDAGNYTVVVSGNYYGAQTSAVATLTINHVPVPGAATLARFPFNGTKARATDLLGSDADGDNLSLILTSTNSAQGGTVRTNATWVFYTPPPGFTNADSFGYTVGDGRGGLGSGTASVTIKNDGAQPANFQQQNQGDGSVKLHFTGIPGRAYTIQFTTSLSSSNWQTLGSTNADAFGAFEFIDRSASGLVERFYRSAQP